RGDRVNIAFCQTLKHGGIVARFTESFIHVLQIYRIDRLHADKDPLAPGGSDQIHQFFVAQQIGADLRHKKDLSFRRDDVTQQRFGALYIDGKVVVDEENRDLALLFAGPGFQQEQFIDDAFIRAEPNGVAEESGDRAELAAVRTASSRFN